MSYYQGNDLRKPSGGIKGRSRGKRKHELGSPPTLTKLAESDLRKVVKVTGGNIKVRLAEAFSANVFIPSEKKCVKTRILGVQNTPANVEYSRRGIITKGTIIRTELGLAKVTSRPGQDGVINAVLIEGKSGA
ncbi:MAG: 30S ribosomal protein S8e [Sulfolobales archaeon]|nr:30S ribosomal protein S8e [Sulfolobales archaeon]MCX8199594.1 30S ribosomal protein S8e [Sulfolobales archaeon]MDW8170547.1 30S ribosomal protein S8e [Desulfurococcaceae archaeon]